MTMITPSYLGETIEYSSLHACRSTLEDPTVASSNPDTQWTYRIDYTPRSADTFTARYLHDRSVLTPDFFTNGGALPGFETHRAAPPSLAKAAGRTSSHRTCSTSFALPKPA